MKFVKLDKEGLYPVETIEINTLDELRAFALGGTGRVEIGFNEIDYDGNKISHPVISSIEYMRRGQNASSQ